MLKKAKAWLHARLHIQYNYTIPGTDVHLSFTAHRLTGKTHVDWSLPAYLLQAERQRLANPAGETQITVTTLLPEGTDASRRLRAPLN